jgi:hypothetical protein
MTVHQEFAQHVQKRVGDKFESMRKDLADWQWQHIQLSRERHELEIAAKSFHAQLNTVATNLLEAKEELRLNQAQLNETRAEQGRLMKETICKDVGLFREQEAMKKQTNQAGAEKTKLARKWDEKHKQITADLDASRRETSETRTQKEKLVKELDQKDKLLRKQTEARKVAVQKLFSSKRSWSI